MSSKFVRTSKYRHVFGTASKKEFCYDNLKVSRNAVDGNLVKVNPLYLSVNWAASGGGAFAVINLEKCGKISSDLPLVLGHTAPVLDTDFSPFDDSLVASASEDTKIMVWSIPTGGLTQHLSTPALTLSGHGRKVTSVLFHPTANHVLTSTSSDLTVKLWDIQKGAESVSISDQHPDTIHSVAYNYNGSLMVTVCKDKKVRIFDPRSAKCINEGTGHQGVKGSQVTWLGDGNRFLTTGFSRTSDRQVSFWDMSDLSAPLKTENLDTSSGSLMPFYDNDTKILYLAGKGDGNIRYFEVVQDDPYMFTLSDYKSSEPQRGLAFLPKRAVNVRENEIARAYKVTSGSVEPISFTVPRKSDIFQADLYPDTVGPQAPMSSQEFFDGKNADPILISMENGFNASATTATPFVPNIVLTPAASAAPVCTNKPKASEPASQGKCNVTSQGVVSNVSVGSLASNTSELDELKRLVQVVQLENEELKKSLLDRDDRIEHLEIRVVSLGILKDDLAGLRKEMHESLQDLKCAKCDSRDSLNQN